jgi:putative DNA primase/helicase
MGFEDIRNEMLNKGLSPNELIADGTIKRFKANADDHGKAGWYIGYQNKTNSGDDYFVFVYGNFKTGERYTSRPNKKLGPDEQAQIKKQLKEISRKANEEKEKGQIEVARKISYEWNGKQLSLPSLYIQNKKISDDVLAKSDIRFDIIDGENVLLIPVIDVDGQIWSVQKIWPDGSKRFETGGKIKGCFMSIGYLEETAPIYLCEGYATGSSIYQATNGFVVCALSANNMEPVARDLLKAHPNRKYIVCGDDDRFGQSNAGRKGALGAAKILNAKCVFPKFDDGISGTDFNDMHIASGLKAVADVIFDDVGAAQDEYSLYKEFFEKKFKGAKKDIISREFLWLDHGLWQSPLNWLDAIKSYAIDENLNHSKIQFHLQRYISELPYEPLMNIPEWDGEDRIAALEPFIKLKGQPWSVFEDAFKEWGANVFRRLFDEGAQNRCIILKGTQGLGKDRLLNSLLSGFKPYYSKFSTNRDERAIWDQVTGNLVLHIEEFDQTGSMSVAFLKDLITRDYATYRSAFERKNLTRKCHGSFISTVNIDSILRDETGNRRFAVFEIEHIDWDYPKDIGLQVMAQFHALYLQGYKAKPETWLAVTEGNIQFEQVDIVPELLEIWDERLKTMMTFGDRDLSFTLVAPVVSDLCKISGWKTKTILSILKVNNRSKKTKNGARYWPKKEGDRSTTENNVVTGQFTAARSVKNYAPQGDRTPNDIGHPIGHHLTSEDDLPF